MVWMEERFDFEHRIRCAIYTLHQWFFLCVSLWIFVFFWHSFSFFDLCLNFDFKIVILLRFRTRTTLLKLDICRNWFSIFIHQAIKYVEVWKMSIRATSACLWYKFILKWVWAQHIVRLAPQKVWLYIDRVRIANTTHSDRYVNIIEVRLHFPFVYILSVFWPYPPTNRPNGPIPQKKKSLKIMGWQSKLSFHLCSFFKKKNLHTKWTWLQPFSTFFFLFLLMLWTWKFYGRNTFNVWN